MRDTWDKRCYYQLVSRVKCHAYITYVRRSEQAHEILEGFD